MLKKNKIGGLIILIDFKSYKAKAIRLCSMGMKLDRWISSTEEIPKLDPHFPAKLISDKGPKERN